MRNIDRVTDRLGPEVVRCFIGAIFRHIYGPGARAWRYRGPGDTVTVPGPGPGDTVATSCYEVVDGEMFERRFDELRRNTALWQCRDA